MASILLCPFLLFGGCCFGQAWKAYTDTADIFKNHKKNEEALAYYQKARTILSVDSALTESYEHICKNMGDVYVSEGKYKQAGPLYAEILEIDIRSHGKEDTAYANHANGLGIIYLYEGQYDKAADLLTEAREVRARLYSKRGLVYASSCVNLANLRATQGDFARAEPLYLEAKTIIELDSATLSNAYAQCCNGLASLYIDQGEYGKAEPLALKSREVRAIVLTTANPAYAASCTTLASLYKAIGQYEKAEALYLEARQLRLRYFGESHPLYAASCNILADLYYLEGQNEKAETLYLEAKKIRGGSAGDGSGGNRADYAETCNNLANLYAGEGRYHPAESLAQEAREIWDAVLDSGNRVHAVNWNILGSIYYGLGDYAKARDYYLRAGKYWQRHLGPGHPYCIQNSGNLAKTSWNLADTAEAGRYYREALAAQYRLIRDVFQFTNEREKAQYIRNGAISGDEYQSFYSNEYPAAYAGELYDLSLDGRSLILGASQRLRQVVLKSGDSALLQGYARWMALKQRLAAVYAGDAANSAARIVALEAEADSLEKVLARNSSTIEKSGNPGNPGKPGQAGTRVYAGRNRSSDIRPGNGPDINLTTGSGRGWQTIRQHLVKGTAAIEFAQYRYYNGKRWTDSVYTVAYLLREDAPGPRSIRLFEERQLDSLLSLSGNADNGNIASIYSPEGSRSSPRIAGRSSGSNGVGNRDGGQGAGRGINPGIGHGAKKNTGAIPYGALYRLVWKPIAPYLAGIHRIYFTPAGLLHRIAFAAIPLNTTQVLSDKYRLIQLNSTASIPGRSETYIRHSDRIRLYGGVLYDADSQALQKAVTGYRGDPGGPDGKGQTAGENTGRPAMNTGSEQGAPGRNEYLRRVQGSGERGEAGRQGWNYLPGTEEEISGIRKLGRSFGVPVTVFSGIDASEESVKALNGSDTPAVLHIATHGYFFPDPGKAFPDQQEAGSRFRDSKDPLFRSGILLAGANNAWNDHPVAGIEDGMLTSYEVSNLYFPGMKLVVLSACETALGKIEGSEGVYGLQRAFRMAGAQNLVMSLWKVPDRETSEFMQLFYKNMLEGRSVGDSFYHTQQTMKSKYRDAPDKWAAWVLISG